MYPKITITLALVVAMTILMAPLVQAATLDEQIRQLNQEAAAQQQQAAGLQAQGNTLANKLAGINAQAAALAAQISAARVKQQKLTAEIEAARVQLALKKQVLGENIRQIYQQSSITPIEILASSKSFSDFVDRQQYLDRIKDHIQQAAKAIVVLKNDLERQQTEVGIAIKQQSDLSAALAVSRAEAAQLLADTRGEESRYAQLSQASSAKAAELHRQQAALLAAQFGGSVSNGTTCGGGYPSKWCNVPRDSVVDNWGMYNRECVSYTAFRVAASGRYMPYWGGRGNAKQWPDNARAAGIPVDGKPRVGDIAVTTAGPYGHVMYVEGVYGGNIAVSQYNFGNNGEYSTMTIPASGLQFIHF